MKVSLQNSPGKFPLLQPQDPEPHCQKIHGAVQKIFTSPYFLAALLPGSLGSFSVLFVGSTPVMIGAFVGCLALYCTGFKVLSFLSRWKRSLQITEEQSAPLPFGQCQVLPSKDTVESFRYKQLLVEHAQNNIVLSDSFCGGASFQRILDILHRKLEINSRIKIVILHFDGNLSQENTRLLEVMQKNYPKRFTRISSWFYWTSGSGNKISMNHVQGLSIDDGRYFIQGSSALHDKYTHSRGLGIEADSGVHHESFGPGVRSSDFVFSSKQSQVGYQFHRELLHLANIYTSLGKLEGSSACLKQLLQDPPKRTPTNIWEIDRAKNSTKQVSVRIFSGGPEDKVSYLAQEILQAIQSAQSNIFIGNMYFNPTKEIENALQDAAQRGVKITILTVGGKGCNPIANQIFGKNTRYCYASFLQKLPKNCQNQVTVYEYGHPNTSVNVSFHKKVLVADDVIIGGSGNFGYKSLISSADHEIHFLAKSSALARRVIQLLEEDCYRLRLFSDKDEGNVQKYPLSTVVTNPTQYTKLSYFLFHQIFSCCLPIFE